MLIGLILLAIVFAACYIFVHPPVWFPVAITSAAMAYDGQFLWTLRITGALFIAAQLILAWIVFRRGRPASLILASSGGVRASWHRGRRDDCR